MSSGQENHRDSINVHYSCVARAISREDSSLDVPHSIFVTILKQATSKLKCSCESKQRAFEALSMGMSTKRAGLCSDDNLSIVDKTIFN